MAFSRGPLSSQEVEMPKPEVRALAVERVLAFGCRARATRGNRWILTSMEDQRTGPQRGNGPLACQ